MMLYAYTMIDHRGIMLCRFINTTLNRYQSYEEQHVDYSGNSYRLPGWEELE